jgi:hypothetical protein
MRLEVLMDSYNSRKLRYQFLVNPLTKEEDVFDYIESTNDLVFLMELSEHSSKSIAFEANARIVSLLGKLSPLYEGPKDLT